MNCVLYIFGLKIWDFRTRFKTFETTTTFAKAFTMKQYFP
ncbi:hypothetical protein LEP1GSC036_4813 [Leptospira weilii str. 2006001853]|uniref:Uncharacterized protein n=4 Tax=Leptospira weilii TaxID=28184 RepID=A0A828YZH8_9LEPT|nr:hypothetical protein LEP1GSC036_4813 [Leptospira weilii str. 2006001853]EMJ66882.1 hypothetical protein LEP1GSC051_0980 [Leptospira sp. P2653]EMM74670.1 hypothetical protein LEP1GSC038_4377 [Leptospira weilii str. 2006001855]EMN45661.1 hypothetical protein LEP1GSC086_2515 [Leptospira weilii str. LNT 1234]EMN88292.1 hypothetical protein LEP1GSC108_1511 [Leptospira weilii str. UI 13098]EMY15841.1 hypothetical protein LEP1GSC043_1007 [Leptospira weilii str. Ecochallenge]